MTNLPTLKPLDLEERQLLAEIAATGSVRLAAEALQITVRRARAWLRRPHVRAIYETIFTDADLELTRRELKEVASQVPDVYEDALVAERVAEIDVECPECGHKFDTVVYSQDLSLRLRAASELARITGLAVDATVRLKGEVLHTVMTVAERQALLAWKSGLPIPPHIEARLIELGIIVPDEGEHDNASDQPPE